MEEKCGINRRDFLKYGAAAAAAVTAQDRVLKAWAKSPGGPVKGGSVSRSTARPRRSIPSTCQQCEAGCGILGFVEGGRLVKIGGNPRHPNNRGRLCAKGQAGVNQLYDPERALVPLKRIGERGQGRWAEIGWDEALGMVAAKLKALQEAGHPEQFIVHAGEDRTSGLLGRFTDAFGTPCLFSHDSIGAANKSAALLLTMGEKIDLNDVANTKYILNFGSNPYEAHALHVSFIQRIIDARVKNGAKLVTFDVRLSNTAGKSDEWLPILPGTDAVVALAMAKTIMERGLYDKDFLQRWTNYPPDKLMSHLSRFSLDFAEAESGVSREDMERIAIEFASTKPATTISYMGGVQHSNGTYTERCIALLNAITGNVDVRGGYCLPRQYALPDLEPVPPKSGHAQGLPLGPSHYAGPMAFNQIKEGRQKVGVYMPYMHNPAFSNSNPRLVYEVLRDEKLVPFFVAVDAFMSETAALADLILPDSTYLESWGMESKPSYELVPFVSLGQPIIPPRGKSRPFMDVLIELAQKLKGPMEKYFNISSSEEYIAKVASGIEGLKGAGGLDYLREKGVWYDEAGGPTYKTYEAKGFKTPSGKFEIYSDALAKAGFNPLPHYEPVSAHKKMRGDELILVRFKRNVQSVSRTSNCKWLSEIAHVNPLWMHPEAASRRGIHSGQRVKVKSQWGSMVATVFVTQGINPRAAAICGTGGHWQYGRIAGAKRFKSSDPDSLLIWWEEHGNGVHPNPVFSNEIDPIGGGIAWMDTTVTVEKYA